MALGSAGAPIRANEQQTPHARLARAAAHGNAFSTANRRKKEGSESAIADA
jgi:hypothetical protein